MQSNLRMKTTPGFRTVVSTRSLFGWPQLKVPTGADKPDSQSLCFLLLCSHLPGGSDGLPAASSGRGSSLPYVSTKSENQVFHLQEICSSKSVLTTQRLNYFVKLEILLVVHVANRKYQIIYIHVHIYTGIWYISWAEILLWKQKTL